MRRRPLVLAVLAAALWLQPPLTSADGPPYIYRVPDRIQGLNDGAPLWVSKERATGPDGHVAWEEIGEKARESYENIKTWPIGSYTNRSAIEGQPPPYNPYVTGPRPDGIYYGVYHFGLRNVASETLEQQLNNAESLIEGEVIAKTVGFTRRVPITLLSVRVDHFGSSKGLSAETPIAHIFWPVAEFTIGDITFEKGDPDYPAVAPEVGDRILFISAQFHEVVDQTVLRAHPKRMAYGRAGSNVYVPVEWGKSDEGNGTMADIREVFHEVRTLRGMSPVEGAENVSVRAERE